MFQINKLIRVRSMSWLNPRIKGESTERIQETTENGRRPIFRTRGLTQIGDQPRWDPLIGLEKSPSFTARNQALLAEVSQIRENI